MIRPKVLKLHVQLLASCCHFAVCVVHNELFSTLHCLDYLGESIEEFPPKCPHVCVTNYGVDTNIIAGSCGKESSLDLYVHEYRPVGYASVHNKKAQDRPV